jgi:hypothetical protein
LIELALTDTIEDLSKEIGVSQTFCYLIIGILLLTIIFAIIFWIMGARRRKKEMKEKKKMPCPACGGLNDPEEILCKFCEEML